MTYQMDLSEISKSHRTEIHAALAQAQSELKTAQANFDRATCRVHFLDYLLHSLSEERVDELEESRGSESGTSKLTLHAAMQQVLLASSTGKLKAAEIITEIERLNLYRMRDGRVPESQQIHARANHYPDMFGKDGAYFYAK